MLQLSSKVTYFIENCNVVWLLIILCGRLFYHHRLVCQLSFSEIIFKQFSKAFSILSVQISNRSPSSAGFHSSYSRVITSSQLGILSSSTSDFLFSTRVLCIVWFLIFSSNWTVLDLVFSFN